jgi:hypothetical protein
MDKVHIFSIFTTDVGLSLFTAQKSDVANAEWHRKKRS